MALNIGDKKFYKSFLLLAVPMAFQSMITTFVNLIDNIMIGQLGDVPIAAVGLANRVFIVYSLVIFGISSGASAFVTQFRGKNDYKGIKISIMVNTVLALIVSVLFFIVSFLFPEFMMALFSEDPLVIIEGAGYLRIISLSFVFTAITTVCSFNLKNMEHPKIPLVGSVISIIINSTLNYILIFGHFGFPALGTNGAAIGTLVARIAEFLFVGIFTAKKLSFLFKDIRDYFNISKSFIKSFIVTVLPVTFNETLWSVGHSVILAVYARVSTQAIASVNIVNVLFDLTSVFLIGAGNATGIIIGKEVGLKRYDRAYDYADRLSLFIPAVTGIISIIMLVICPYFLKIFNVSEEVRSLTVSLYIIMTVFTPVRAYNHVNIVGSLRYGGDVLFCMITDGACVWLIGVLGAWLSGIALSLPILAVYTIVQCEEAVKGVVLYLRMRKRNWIKDLVN